jgi:hypothetical protein
MSDKKPNTPGPWWWIEQNGEHLVIDRQRVIVDLKQHTGPTNSHREEDAINAPVIAAAPVMLAALEQAIAEACAAHGGYPHNAPENRPGGWLWEARAAVAQARSTVPTKYWELVALGVR